MKKVFRGILFVLILASLFLSASLSVKAEGMEVVPDKTTVQPGDSITVTVSFSGNDIWFAQVTITCDGAIVQGSGTYLIEPDRGQKEVSETFIVTAIAPGSSTIKVEGVTDEDESLVYTSDFFVTVNGDGSPDRPAGTGGNARVDADQKTPEGEYINQRPPEENQNGQELTTKEEKASKDSKKETTEPESKTDPVKVSQNKNTAKQKSSKKTLIILIVSAVLFVLAASTAAMILIGRRMKSIKEEAEQEEPHDGTTDDSSESDDDSFEA